MDEELLGRRLVLRELPDHPDVRRRDADALAARPRRLHRDEGVLEDGRVGVLRRAVGRDRVVDPAPHARGEEAIVGSVVPGEDLRRHALVEDRLGKTQRLPRLLGVDQDGLPGWIRFRAAEAEQERPPVQVGVGALGELDARRMALGLERPRRQPGQLPGVRRLKAGLFEQIFAPEHREENVVDRQAVLPPLDLDQGPGRRDPAAVFLSDLAVDVRDVQEALVVEPRQDRRAVVDDVVARACGELRGHARRQLEVGDVVDPHFDAVLVSPLFRELVEPGVVRGNEMAPL